MRKFLTVLLAVTCLHSCSSIQVPRDPSALRQEPIYQNADYLALVAARCRSSTEKYLDELSGFLIFHNNRYYAVTAGHLHKNGETITEILVSLKKDPNVYHKAALLGYDHSYDIAVLGFDEGFQFTGHPATLGDSDSVGVDDTVYSLGHPANSYWHISMGAVKSVSAKSRYRALNCRLIQHSAISGFGSSGGPILNTGGRVVGMNAVMVTLNDRQGISDDVYAVPVNVIKKRLDALISGYKN